ncbi:MAG: methyltransferase domain-containing protein [Acidobacteria bacterium]|nr:MAG: methyltransferase domain-containing protein [Acidobacteriota bacterium]
MDAIDATPSPPAGDVLRVLLSKDQVRRYYNKLARFYDRLAEASEQPMRDAGIELLAPAPGERLLEIGCGTGHSLTALAERTGSGGAVYGVELAERMLVEARRHLRRRRSGGRVLLVQGDGEHLPVAGASLDGIFMSFVLELFDTPAIPRLLAECRRALRPGGRLAVVGLSKEGDDSLLRKAYEWTHEHFPNLLDCRPIHVRTSLARSGFSIRAARLERMWVPVEVVLGINPEP